MANNQITESSGLAYSRHGHDILWTHNDSGDTPRIFAFDLSGRDLGVFKISGALAVDWEDMASAKIGAESYLLIADVGDNLRNRDFCTLYLVREPNDLMHKNVSRTLKIKKINFRYEDGSRDCEAVAVDPDTDTIYLISKSLGPKCKVYSLPLDTQKEMETARAVAPLMIQAVTAMDISPDGRRAVVLTYNDAYEFTRKDGETWAEAFKSNPSIIPVPMRTQGESICYSPDGLALYLTSENAPSPLWEVRIKEK